VPGPLPAAGRGAEARGAYGTWRSARVGGLRVGQRGVRLVGGGCLVRPPCGQIWERERREREGGEIEDEGSGGVDW
jgi:hypothetical protein